MTKPYRSIKVSTLINTGIAIAFVATAALTVVIVNHKMRQQALIEAEAKMRLILDHNMAVHTYFTQILKPNLFAWTEPFQDADYFDPSWMSSTHAIREMQKYFTAFNPDDYYYKDAAINARSPENEADADERAFLLELKANPALEARSAVRAIDGEPYLVVLRPGEVLEPSCLRCHSDPADAPQDLVRRYGPERSFYREAELGLVASAVSVRVPLAVAYAEADRISVQLSLLLLALLGVLFVAQYWISHRLVFQPLDRIRDVAVQISGDSAYLGKEIALPFGGELRELTTAFNAMSVGVRHSRDHLEERVRERTAGLETANAQLEREIVERARVEAQLAEQIDELRRWHEITLGRERRVMELKREANELLAQAGQPPRYLSVADEAGSHDLGDLEGL